MNEKLCPNDKILNAKTNRCVLKTGNIGKKLLQEQNIETKPQQTYKTCSTNKKNTPPCDDKHYIKMNKRNEECCYKKTKQMLNSFKSNNIITNYYDEWSGHKINHLKNVYLELKNIKSSLYFY